MLGLCYISDFDEKQDMLKAHAKNMLKRYRENVLEEQDYQIGFACYKGMIYRYYMWSMRNVPEALENSKWNLNMIHHARMYASLETASKDCLDKTVELILFEMQQYIEYFEVKA